MVSGIYIEFAEKRVLVLIENIHPFAHRVLYYIKLLAYLLGVEQTNVYLSIRKTTATIHIYVVRQY